MMRTVLLVLLVSLPGRVIAQPHPCDVVTDTTFLVPSWRIPALRLGFCWLPKDSEGLPITDPVGFLLEVNSGPDTDLGTVPPMGMPNAKGEQYYEVASHAISAGVLTVKAYTTALGSSAPSAPITVMVTNTLPSPDGWRVPTDGPLIVDTALAEWAFGAGGVILRNGVQAADGVASLLLWWHGDIYAEYFGLWFRWSGNSWIWLWWHSPLLAPTTPSSVLVK